MGGDSMIELRSVSSSNELIGDKKYNMTAIFEEECSRVKEYIDGEIENILKIGCDNKDSALHQGPDVISTIERTFTGGIDVWDEKEIKSFDTYVRTVPKEKEIKAYKWLRNISLILEMSVFGGIIITEDISLLILIPAVILAGGAYLFGHGMAILVGAHTKYNDDKFKGGISTVAGIIFILAMTVIRSSQAHSSSYVVAVATFVIALFIAIFEFMYNYDGQKRAFLMAKILRIQQMYAAREHKNLFSKKEWQKVFSLTVDRKAEFLKTFPDSE